MEGRTFGEIRLLRKERVVYRGSRACPHVRIVWSSGLLAPDVYVLKESCRTCSMRRIVTTTFLEGGSNI